MDDTPTRYEALCNAIALLGSQAELARICGVSPTAVWKWVKSSKQLPAEFVLRVEARTAISRHHLRPDIYPVDLPPPGNFLGIDDGFARVSFDRHQISQRSAA